MKHIPPERRDLKMMNFDGHGFKPIWSLLREEPRSLSARQIATRLNKCGYHFQYEIPIRGFTRSHAQIKNALAALHGFRLTAWTAYHISDRLDHDFKNDRLFVAFFWDEEAKPFLLMLSAMGHLEDALEEHLIRAR